MTAAPVLLPLRPRFLERVSLASARDDRLYFAQVREDARVELAALHPGPNDRVVAVSSGGCTALSLLGAGAAEVHAVDVNRAQNHLVELKAAACRRLRREEAIAFLGGSASSRTWRFRLYQQVRVHLTKPARDYWDARSDAIRRGAIAAGVSERFIRLVCWLVRHVVHSPSLVNRMLACRSIEEQRELFGREWNTRRWRWLFVVLLNRWSMSRAYDPRFFANVGRTNSAEHFLQLANHALTEVPIADNYFLHKMFSGYYAVEHPDGVPPYLGAAGFSAIAHGAGSLLLVDGSVTDHLRTLPARSVNAFALSNVCEWLDEPEIAALFREVERVAAPGGRVVFRNFVGWTEIPAGCTRLVEDRELGAALIRGDRSAVQPRVVVCRVRWN
jgi:S-adenosylmethionine-diacylglycerol 3-amino-3-carboxypropyl transferase